MIEGQEPPAEYESTVDFRLMEKFGSMSYKEAGSLSGGSAGGGNMEGRVARLEAGVSHLERDVADLRVDMKDVRERLISVEKTMTTKGFVFSVYGIVSALLAAIILFQTG